MTTKEQQIEQGLISKLDSLKYDYRSDIRDQNALDANFREKFEALNRVKLSNAEFTRLKEQIISDDVFASAKRLREVNTLDRDDDTPLHYTLVDIKDWCRNSFEVVNQLRMNTQKSYHRYDVILLINGVPVVQIELKRFEISPRAAMQQIVDYKNDVGNGYNSSLLCFLQLFIVSNGYNTYYFTNNKPEHFSFNADEQFLPVYQFAHSDNNKIVLLDEFADKLLSKCELGEMISRYMVLVVTEERLMIMRPYQIYAVQAIVDSIHRKSGNGYIWHTTGSGKTLTSFKASTLLKDNPDIEKCLFVVDRKDLDRQTREEFNKFQEGCVEENTNTETLVTRLLSTNYADKVIVTTIQKLGLALDEKARSKKTKGKTDKVSYKERLKPLADKRIVFIFDECHRSQFGDNHDAIKSFFPNAQLFGFTGTPIFVENATVFKIEEQANNPDQHEKTYKTTKDIFQQQLHSYTIADAIEDKNVLKFHIDYYKPEGKDVPPKGFKLPREVIAKAILEKHDKATAGRKFNAVLATASINEAIDYFKLFKELQTAKAAEDPNFLPLNVTCVFSPPAEGNKDTEQLQSDLPQEQQDNQVEPEAKKAALKAIMEDYNQRYGTNHSLSNFDAYYQDVQQRIKHQKYSNEDYPHSQKIDLVIVVDMLLTGFDSKYLNTLYVDKDLKYHGLIQALSRTNRILNDTKPSGQVLDFRQQKEAVDAAIKLFSGDEHKARASEIWLVESADEVINKLDDAVRKLQDFMRTKSLACTPDQVVNLKGESAKIEFIKHFKEIQRLKTQLDQYTDISPEQEETIEQIIPEDSLLGFRGVYLDVAKDFKKTREKQPSNQASENEQLDFDLVLFATAIIDYDYIMRLVTAYASENPEKQQMTREALINLIRSDAKFQDEAEDLEAYIRSLNLGEGLTEDSIRQGYENFKVHKSAREMSAIAQKHSLSLASLQAFVDQILGRMIFDGERLNDLLAPLDLGWRARTKKELELMEDLVPLLKKLAQGQDISGLAAYEE